MKFKARTYRPKHKPGQMNSVERDYAAHLELLKKAGEILEYSYECETLKIGQDCRYTPDFRVIKKYATDYGHGEYIEFHEVKGTVRKKRTTRNTTKIQLNTTKPYIEDDALVKIKTAAEIHPYKFILVWKGTNGQWEKREIN